jgi:hypothetical protein
LKATTAGQCLLRLNATDGLQLWMGKTPVAVSPEIPLPMAVGVHRLTFAIELAKREGGRGLRVEVIDSPATTANVQPVGGK